MSLARNSVDGCGVYYEDDGGRGTPLVVLNGLGDPVAASRRWGVTQALAPSHRLILIDHRGHGGSDKPHDPAAYTTALRVGDVVSMLDDLGIERAHFIGASWGGRLLFGLAEHAPERAFSLTIGGQTPFRFNPESRGVQMVTAAFEQGNSMEDFIESLGGLGDVDDELRVWTLDNDFEALAAAWRCALDEGDVVSDLTRVWVPCLIYAGTKDSDFFEDAKRAAEAMPNATFVPLQDLNHLEAHANVDDILPHIRAFIDGIDAS